MKTVILSIIAFLATTFRSSPQAAQTITVKDDKQTVISFNQQFTEYTLDSDIKPISAPKTTMISTKAQWWNYPDNIKATVRDGDDLLVLVNKEYRLSEDYAPSDLVSAGLSGIRKGENFYIRNILISDLKNMVSDAKANDIDLSIVSAYRSYKTQIDTYNYWVRVNGNNTDAADQISARAGHSQHQLGTAIDFTSSEITDGLTNKFMYTEASKWLEQNAWKYGFVLSFPLGYEGVTGYSYESWHYRYIGKENAKEMHDSGMILEVYLENKN